MSYWYIPYDIYEFERIAGIGFSCINYGESPNGSLHNLF